MRLFHDTSRKVRGTLRRMACLILAVPFIVGCSMPTMVDVQSAIESEAFMVDIDVAATASPVPIEIAVTPSPIPVSPTPISAPTPTPTPTPTAAPTLEPTATSKPTPKPTNKPTAKPTMKPTAKPTSKPTAAPKPTEPPAAVPVITPVQGDTLATPPMATMTPTPEPTPTPVPATPTPAATPKPTEKPTPEPTKKPAVDVSGPYSYEDLELAARVAYFETGTDDGYKAVLSVIYHRCMSSKFGGKKTSIPTEVYRSSQFSVVKNSKFESTTAPSKIIEYADDIFNRGRTTVPETVLFFRAGSRGTEWGDKVYYDTIGGNAFFHAG